MTPEDQERADLLLKHIVKDARKLLLWVAALSAFVGAVAGMISALGLIWIVSP